MATYDTIFKNSRDKSKRGFDMFTRKSFNPFLEGGNLPPQEGEDENEPVWLRFFKRALKNVDSFTRESVQGAEERREAGGLHPESPLRQFWMQPEEERLAPQPTFRAAARLVGGIADEPIREITPDMTPMERRLAKARNVNIAKAPERAARIEELEKSTFSPEGTRGANIERKAGQILDVVGLLPGGAVLGGVKKGAQAAKLAGKVVKGAEEVATAFKVGDKITDGLVNAEVIAKGSLKMGKTDVPGFKVKIISGKEAGKESFIGAADAKLLEAPLPPAAKGIEALPENLTRQQFIDQEIAKLSPGEAVMARRNPESIGATYDAMQGKASQAVSEFAQKYGKEPWQMTREEYKTSNPEAYSKWLEKLLERDKLALGQESSELAKSNLRYNIKRLNTFRALQNKFPNGIPPSNFGEAISLVQDIEKSTPIGAKIRVREFEQNFEEVFKRKHLTNTSHREAISKALSEGKPVPPEVLKDYPELVQQAKTSPTFKIGDEIAIREPRTGETAAIGRIESIKEGKYQIKTASGHFFEESIGDPTLSLYKQAKASPTTPPQAPEAITEAATLKQRRAMQWVEDEGIVDMSGNPITVDTDGNVTLYHRTSKESAANMQESGKFLSKENTNETFFSNKPTGQAEGYGDTIVSIKVPVQDIRLDDAFKDEIHLAVSNKKLGKANIVVSEAPPSTPGAAKPLAGGEVDYYGYEPPKPTNVRTVHPPLKTGSELPPVPPEKPPTAMGAGEIPPEKPPPMPSDIAKIAGADDLLREVKSAFIRGKKGKILQAPGVKQVAGLVNPIAVSEDAGLSLRAVAGKIDDQINGATVVAMATPQKEFVPIKSAFKLKKGIANTADIIQKSPLPNGINSKAMHDIVEYAPWYDFTGAAGEKMKRAVEAIRETSKKMSDMLRAEGILVDDPTMRLLPGQIRALKGEDGWTFLHRVVMTVKEESAEAVARDLINTLRAENIPFPKTSGESAYQYLSRFAEGVKGGTIKAIQPVNELIARFADLADVKIKKQTLDSRRSWDTVAEGMKSGVSYASDPMVEMEKQIRASYQLIKKKRMSEAIPKLVKTTTPAERAMSEMGFTPLQVEAISNQADDAKKLLAALNRALRGERGVPAQILTGAERSFPDEAAQIKELLRKFQQNPIPETAAEVQAYTAKAKALEETASKQLDALSTLEAKYAERMGPAGTEEYGRVIGLPGLGNRVIVSQEGKTGQAFADELRRHIGYMPKTELDKVLNAAGVAGNVMRMFRLGFDLSFAFIQGALTLGYDLKNIYAFPVRKALGKNAPITNVWLKSNIGGAKAAISKHPELHLERFLSSPEIKPYAIDGLKRGLLIETAEPVEAAGQVGGLTGKLAEGSKPRTVAEFIKKHILGRSDAAFTSARVETGVNLYKAGFKMAEDAGKLNEWAKDANLMSGVLSTRGMGISSGQRNLESALAFMSPRFTRSKGGILAHIVTNPGSYTAKEAASSLAALLATGFGIYALVNRLQEKDVDLNPFDPNHGKVEVAGQRFYLGGMNSDIRNLLQWIDSATYQATGERISLSGREDRTPPLLSLEPNKSLIFRQLRSRTSPLTGEIINIVSGKDFLGRPVTIPTEMANIFTPSYLEPYFKDEEGNPLVGMGGQFIGLSAAPIDVAYDLSVQWKEDFRAYNAIPTDPVVVSARKIDSREDYRKKNPDLDAKLFVTGQVNTVLTPKAGQEALRLIQVNRLDPDTIPGIKKNKELAAKQKELGVEDTRITPTDRLQESTTKGTTYVPPPSTPTLSRISTASRISRTRMPSPLASFRARRTAVRTSRRTTMPSPLRR